jgi:hypothetical protein
LSAISSGLRIRESGLGLLGAKERGRQLTWQTRYHTTTAKDRFSVALELAYNLKVAYETKNTGNTFLDSLRV